LGAERAGRFWPDSRMGVLVFLTIAVAYLTFSARDRSNALAGAGVLLPFNQYLPNAGIPFVNVHTLVMVALAWGILRTPTPPLGQGRPRVPLALSLLALVVLVAYLQGGLLGSFTRELFVLFKDKISILFVCVAAIKMADSLRAVQRAFWGCLCGVGAETLFCLLEFLFQSGNVTGHMETRNATGAFLATYTCVYLGVSLALRSDPRRRWFVIAVAVGCVAIMGTNSRGGVVALGATFLLVLLVKNRILFVAVLVIILSYQVWMPERFSDRFETVDAEAESGGTFARRVRIWRAGLSVLSHHPFGVGLGRFGPAVGVYSDDPAVLNPYTGEGRAAHNEIVLVSVEFGIQGLVVFCCLLAGLGARSLKTYRSDPDLLTRGLGLGAACGLMGGFVASLSLTLLLRTDISGVVWILLGLCARRASDLKRTPPRKLSPREGDPVSRFRNHRSSYAIQSSSMD